MNKSQRSRYFTLWAEAAREQKWNPKDEAKRRAVTLEATNQESTTGLDQGQITALFDHLKWLANPYDLDLAMPVANPEQTTDTNRARQLVWRITQTAAKAGLSSEYLAKMAEGKCKAHRVRRWQELPLVELLQLSYTVEQRAASKARRAAAEDLQADCSGRAAPDQVDPF